MKLLLELIGDACQLLSGLDKLSELRPESRERLNALLHQLRFESTRLLDDDEAHGQVATPPEHTMRRDAFLQRGLEALAKERYEEAGAVLLEAITHFPEDDEFYSYLGLIAWESQDLEAAQRYYARAVELVFAQGVPARIMPEDFAQVRGLRALEGRALCLYKLGRLDEALPIFERLGADESVLYVGCRYLAGEIHHLGGDLDAAIAQYSSVALEPAVLYNLGLAFYQKDDLERAATTFVQAFVSNVHIASLLLGRFSFRPSCVPGYLGSETYAEEFVEACVRLWQKDPSSFSFLQRCFDHPLVQGHLQSCASQAGDKLMGSLDGLAEQEGWLEQLHTSAMLVGLAQRILQRLDA
ncbi:MAG: tetratricopeptide repeat protein [Bradymonadaceae bacterium]|nr:tetratricopeptide repeat protein [Lujinxingiaceae bacterium]